MYYCGETTIKIASLDRLKYSLEQWCPTRGPLGHMWFFKCRNLPCKAWKKWNVALALVAKWPLEIRSWTFAWVNTQMHTIFATYKVEFHFWAHEIWKEPVSSNCRAQNIRHGLFERNKSIHYQESSTLYYLFLSNNRHIFWQHCPTSLSKFSCLLSFNLLCIELYIIKTKYLIKLLSNFFVICTPWIKWEMHIFRSFIWAFDSMMWQSGKMRSHR